MKRTELIWTFIVFAVIIGIALIVPLKQLLIFGAIFLPCIFFGGILVRVILMLLRKKKISDQETGAIAGGTKTHTLSE